jgi:hypothetical protein
VADNVVLNSGSGGETAATDDCAGVQYQRVKLTDGTANSTTVIAAGGGVEAGALRVTIASDSTGVLSVDDNGGSLTVDNGGTFAVQATIAVGATTIAKAEDAAHASGDVGVPALTVRQDTAAALSGTDADYQPLITDASGRLHVNVGNTVTVGSHAVTNAGTFVTQENGAALTSLQLLDDTVFAEDVAAQAADKGIAILAVRRDADTSLVGADNDYANLQVNASGSLKVAITAGAGSGGTSIADGATFTRDTTSVTLAAAAVESSAPTLTNGDAAALSMTIGGALRVAVASGGIAGIAEDSAAAGGEEGIMMLAVRRDAASSGVGADGDFAALSVTSDGSLRVSGSSGTTQYTEDGASAGAEALCLMGAVRRDTPASSSGTDGDYSTVNVSAAGRVWTSANIDQINGVTPLMGNGASGTGAQRVTIANDSTGILAAVTNVATIGTSVTPGTSAAHLGKAEDAAHTTGDVGVMALGVRADTLASTAANGDYVPFLTDSVGAVWTRDSATQVDDAAFTPGTSRLMPVAFTADESSTDSVDEGDAGAARMTLDRKQIITAYVHAAAGGATPHQNLDCDETEDDIKTSPGKLFWVHAVNLAATKRYLKFYNATAANTTVGSTTPVLTFPIPTMGDTNGAGFTINFGDIGVQFDTAICVAATTGFAVADTGAPGANEIILNCGYA